MNQNPPNTDPNPVCGDRIATRTDSGENIGLESGVQGLRESPAFRGPVEPLDGHDSNDHLALIYEDREEQFAAAVPFVKQGIERGERCLYIADDNSRTEVLTAMESADFDVDAALDSGTLTLHTKQDTCCRGGTFDPDEMITFVEAAIEEADEEYEALRVTGEMTWIFGDELRIADLMEYEGKVNRLLPEEDCIVLCQYNRNRFPTEVLRDVVRTHPHLVYNDTVSHNAYYTPPEEFFGPERPDREIERMLRTLRNRTHAMETLSRRERQLQRQNERLESFASMLAHELRNPLSVAQIYLQKVEEDGDAAEKVATALDRIEEIIDVLLVTARTNEVEIDDEAVDLAEAAADAWDDLSPENATLEVGTDRTIQMDPVHCWHLLENLFSNAVEHGTTGNRSLTREAVEQSGETAERDDEALTVRVGDLPDGFYVADDGIGIPESEREAVFDAGHSTESGGLGLGLTFVARLMETYNWDFAVTESEAGGARFEFRGVETET
jgi:signal transduction histidine kinase